MKPLRWLAFGWFVVLGAASAQAADGDFAQWLQGVRQEAVAQGIGTSTLDRALGGIEPIPRVIELDRHQPETSLTFNEYVDPGRQRRSAARPRRNASLKIARCSSESVRAMAWRRASSWRSGGSRPISGASPARFPGDSGARHAGLRWPPSGLLPQGADERAADRRSRACRSASHDRLVGRSHGPKPVHAVELPRLCRELSRRRPRPTSGRGARTCSPRSPIICRSVGWRRDQSWGDAGDAAARGSMRRPIRAARGGRSREWSALGVRRVDGQRLAGRRIRRRALIAPAGLTGRHLSSMTISAHSCKWNNSSYFAIAVGYLADGMARR